MKDITLLIAHPDDEIIFLWPFLDRVKRIVCASDDSHNPERVWCKERGKCLREVGELLGCEIVCHSNNSEFYSTETRHGSLKLLASDLIACLPDTGIVATHNAWGEYSHLDHILCHHIARTWQARGSTRTVLVTDIATEINWLPVTAWRQSSAIVPGNVQSMDRADLYRHELDRALYDRIKAIYDARGCWTWSFEPVAKCRVHSL